MKTLSEMTNGMFVDRETEHGAPTAFTMDGTVFVVLRAEDENEPQGIECIAGIGAVAICRTDGEVLGYGTVAHDDLTLLADLLDTQMGPTAGRPLERISAHGLHLLAPLDEIPETVRDMLLAESVPPELVDMMTITDDLIAEILSGAHHEPHGHHHPEGEMPCEHCEGKDVDELRARVDRLIEEHGHAVINVLGNDQKQQHSYTVGLADAGWGELVVMGLDANTSQMILNNAVHWLRRQERRPDHGLTIPDAISVPLRLRRTDFATARPYLAVAANRMERLHGGKAMDVRQVLWPDADGVFPDERGYDDKNLRQELI